MHDDHPPENFTPPFDLSKIISIHIIPGVTSSYIESNAANIHASQSLIDVILGMDIETLRELPVYNFVRMSYAIMVLVKVYISSKTPASKIGSVLNPESLKLGLYLKSLINKLIDAVGPKECRAPYTFLGMLIRFNEWYKSQETNAVFTPPPENKAVDEFWLPPMPRVYWEARGDLPDPFSTRLLDKGTLAGHLDNNIPSFGNNDNIGVDNQALDADLLGELRYEAGGNELDMDQFMLLGGMEMFNPGFNNWFPDLDIGNPAMHDHAFQGSQDSSI